MDSVDSIENNYWTGMYHTGKYIYYISKLLLIDWSFNKRNLFDPFRRNLQWLRNKIYIFHLFTNLVHATTIIHFEVGE